MFKYKSKCRWNILLQLGDEIVEIQPYELFESNTLIESRYLELIQEEVQEKLIEESVEEPIKKKKAKE
jgi:hypothetical protein